MENLKIKEIIHEQIIKLAIKLLNIEQGDLVFCSSLTFVASCNPIIHEGAEPVFIDSEYNSLNMSPVALKKAFKYYSEIGRLPKVVIVVHLYGESANMDEIIDICSKYNVPIIEDTAESLGATYKGNQTGILGKYGIFSFNNNKIITTSGDRMLIYNDEETIKNAKFLEVQSRNNKIDYQYIELGDNHRMSNVLADVGRGQLRILDERIKKKKYIYEYYKEAFKDINEIEMTNVCDYGEDNYWLSIGILSTESKVKPIDIILALEEENIESRQICKPLHIEHVYKKYSFFSSYSYHGISVSEDIFNRGICLPSDTKMTEEDLNRVIFIIRNVFNK